ncbi:P-loop NTPase fold protein [Amycolatopsis sp. NPDC049688]|uniref:P-loop NTPase fold protein n=1 Tax=Amycolatopsis sp. NPDC049688 TaxID=3154733 RepID=UPI003449FE2D
MPSFDGEFTRGRDLLGVRQDASALAVLIASTALKPPLAVGMFGEWGSGKTFLMRSLEREIDRLTGSGTPEFGRHVRSVWFNAWHYADANLWASLVHEIFHSLQGDRGPHPGQALDRALADLAGIQQVTAEAAGHVAAAEQAAREAKTDLAGVEQRYQEATKSAAKVTGRDVWAAVTVDAGLRQKLNDAATELGLPAVGESAREVAHAVDEVRATVRRGRLLATTGPVWKSPLVLGLVVGLVVSAAGLVLGSVIESSHSWLAPMVAAAGQLAALAGGAAGWLIRQAGLARRLLGPAEAVQRQIDERLAAIEAQHRVDHALAQQRLAESETRLATAHRLLAEAEAAEAAANAELSQLTGPRLLERYLSERAGSADYGQYLGVVALAHRDLQDLDRHLQAAASPADQDDQDGQDGQVDRIVLYVDDLDRCAPEVVVRVLEAVHLLLALPLFVVVVGVDVRWLVRSIRQRQPLLIETAESGLAPATPVDYLDKIFQLTYHLPAMTPEACAGLLHHVAVSGSPVADRSSPGASPAPGIPEQTGSAEAPVRQAGGEREAPEGPDTASQAAALQLDDAELAVLRQVAPLVGSSPRIAKRFVNVYRICKARVLADVDLRAGDLAGLLPLTALAVGLPTLVPRAFDTGAPDGEVALSDWLRRAVAAAPGSPEARRVAAFLSAGEGLLDLPMAGLLFWLPVVQRFAWPASGRS